MEKVKESIKKILTKEVILYVVFGIITTLINLVSFYIWRNNFIYASDS